MPLPDYETKLLQNAAEFEEFLALLQSEGVRSYLEIGLGWGGSLWRVGNCLPRGSRIVAVDKTWTESAHDLFRDCLYRLTMECGHKCQLILGNSNEQSTVEQVKELGPFDCVFIDGDHSYEGAMADWVNYGPLGRIVAFHDISWNETWKSKVPGRQITMGVPKVWDEAKAGRRSREIKRYGKGNYYGIGVVWP